MLPTGRSKIEEPDRFARQMKFYTSGQRPFEFLDFRMSLVSDARMLCFQGRKGTLARLDAIELYGQIRQTCPRSDCGKPTAGSVVTTALAYTTFLWNGILMQNPSVLVARDFHFKVKEAKF